MPQRRAAYFAEFPAVEVQRILYQRLSVEGHEARRLAGERQFQGHRKATEKELGAVQSRRSPAD